MADKDVRDAEIESLRKQLEASRLREQAAEKEKEEALKQAEKEKQDKEVAQKQLQEATDGTGNADL